jgi:hypothetical protein
LRSIIPKGFKIPEVGGDYAGLPVAWGLSLDPTEIGSIMRQSEIEDIPPARMRDYTGNFTYKDQA